MNKEEDEDINDDKQPRMTGLREMVNPSAENLCTMVDDHLAVVPGQGQEIRKHTP